MVCCHSCESSLPLRAGGRPRGRRRAVRAARGPGPGGPVPSSIQSLDTRDETSPTGAQNPATGR
eukprot:scaffold2610_cov301-Prasinococcus_capsulatus_cf.AAC.1